MAEQLNGLYRNAMCGELRLSDLNKEVVLNGWVQRRRNLGGLIFIDVRDKSGICQVVFDQNCSVFEKAELLRSEFVIAVKGKVCERQSKTNKIPTGDIEIEAANIEILGKCKNVLPF